MVIKYAKSLANKAKSKVSKTGNVVSSIGGRLRRNSSSELDEIENLADDVYDYESKINSSISEMSAEYKSKKSRAEQKLSEFDEKEFSLDSIAIDNSTIELSNSDEYGASLFGENEVIELESDNLEDYVKELGREIEVRDQEIEECKNALETIEDQTVGDILDANYQDNRSYSESLAQSARMDALLSERLSSLQNERGSLGYELVHTVDEYSDKLYDEAVSISEKLGGTKRDNKGEFDIIRELANSRQNLLSRKSQNIGRSSVMHESRQALEKQSILVDKYLKELEARKDGIETLYEIANDKVDQNMMKSSQERLDSINQGFEGLADVVNGESYDNVYEALEDTLAPAYADTEPTYTENRGNEATIEGV